MTTHQLHKRTYRDQPTLAKLRWAYSYLCFPREALLLGPLQQQIDDKEGEAPIILDHVECSIVESALSICRALMELERRTCTPLRILDGKGRTSPLLLTDAEIEASIDGAEDETP